MQCTRVGQVCTQCEFLAVQKMVKEQWACLLLDLQLEKKMRQLLQKNLQNVTTEKKIIMEHIQKITEPSSLGHLCQSWCPGKMAYFSCA